MKREVLHGTLLDDEFRLSLREVCEVCGVSETWVLELISEGALEPIRSQRTEWWFDVQGMRRLRMAHRLHRDLGVNAPGIALALDLIDQLENLRRQARS